MDKRTAEALEGSIRKWEKIVDGTGLDHGPLNCPLCQLFYLQGDNCCTGCPVMKKSGKAGCNNTPYVKWDDLGWKHNYDISVPEIKKAAEEELEFLRSLREEK